MKARTIYPPYAWAIFHGLKWYETMPDRCDVRGRVAIHAASGTPAQEVLRILSKAAQAQGDRIYTPKWIMCLPRGAIIGTVEIIDCLPVERVRNTLPAIQLAFGDYSDGRLAAKLANPILFPKPIPMKGQQGWWDADLPFELDADGSDIPVGSLPENRQKNEDYSGKNALCIAK